MAQPPQVAWLGGATHGPGRQSFTLPHLWAVHWYGYAAPLWLHGRSVRLRRGTMTVQPPGTESVYEWRRPSRHLGAHFALATAGAALELPMVIEPGQVRPGYARLLAEAVEVWPVAPARATAALWLLLSRMMEDLGPPPRPGGTLPPAVAQAVRFIEQHLTQPLRVTDVARASGVSHNHLIRLFRASFGCTIAGFVRRRRTEKAHHMLTASTLPIKAVAVECGVPDLQAFNKLIRGTFRTSPTALRHGRRR